jgi:DNA-3-methyladenine glycosylase
MMKKIFTDFLERPAVIVAPQLLGCILERDINGKTLRVRIVETEAYDETDAASHSYKGRTPRTDIMFGEAGHLYVYFTYGMHYCCNVVVGKEGVGAAVLIRAVEPLNGEAFMQDLRSRSGVELTNGPAKLCQALGIDKKLNGHDLTSSPLKLILQDSLNPILITQTQRIGISQAKDVPWRFYMTDNKYVSKK